MPTNGTMDRVSGLEAAPRAGESFAEGLWRRNPGLVQLLGLCPLLAVSTNVGSALGLALATMVVLALSNLVIALLRGWTTPETRIAAFVVVIASSVTVVELLVRAFAPALHAAVGLFLPLIVTNCTILARAESFASRHGPGAAVVDGLAMGLGFALVLLLLGATRELIGRGTLFSGLDLLFGAGAAGLEVSLADGGLLLALLPPGAFLLLGCLVAAQRALSRRSGPATRTGER